MEITKGDLIAKLREAASIERRIRDRERRRMESRRSNWCEYFYTEQDKRNWIEPDRRRLPEPNSKEMQLLDDVITKWLPKLGMRKDRRTVTGKKIIWLRAYGFSFREIARKVGVSPTTCKKWYEQDIDKLSNRIK